MAEIKKYAFDNFVVEKGKIINLKDPKPAPVEEQDEDEFIEDEIIEEAPIIEEVPPEITYTQEELDEKTRQAEERGYERGYKESKESNDAKNSSLLDSINDKLKSITSDSSQINNEVESQFLDLSKAVVKQLLPKLSEENATDIVNNFVKDNFNNFKKEAKLSFYINPDIISYVQENISKLADANDYEGKISLHKDENLGLSDCRIEWDNGGVECNTGGLINKISNLIDDNQINKTGDNKDEQ